MSERIKTPMMDIRLRVIGVKKRQRSVKVHNLDVATDLPYTDVDLNGYVGDAMKVLEREMRTSESVTLYLSPWTKIDHPEGYSMKEVTFGDKRYRSMKL